MPIGVNAGGNLNIFMFEVGFLDVNDDTGNGQPFTVGIHPLVVAPQSIQYTDMSRSPIVQTAGGAIKTTSGRALRTVDMQGTFGVESRGLALYIGNGETRFQRFYNEVVRMGEALNNDQVQESVDILRGTPFLPLLLLPYNPEKHVPYINFYDFWNERQFAVTIKSWRDSRHHARGGASGLVHYQMQIMEEGPIVTGSFGSALIGALFNGLTTWAALNDLLKSYTLSAIFNSAAAFGGIFVTQFGDTLSAVQGQIDSVTALVGGFAAQQGSNDALASYFTQTAALDTAAEALIDSLTNIKPPEADTEAGAVGWSSQDGEGGNAGMDTSDQIDGLEDVADAARFQQAAGVFFGWDRGSYQEYVSGRSDGGRGNDIAGTIDYVVGPTDTEATISLRFGISWDRILEVSDLGPDEALLEGATIQIPQLRGRGSQTINGLPTFGSHVGRDAWGQDLPVDLAASDGRHVVIREDELLIQGSEWLIDAFATPLLDTIDRVPALVQEQFITAQLQRAMLSDKRISSVDRIDFDTDESTGAASLSVTMTAINGGTIQTGRPRNAA